MKNTILISGTVNSKTKFNLYIWASRKGEALQFVKQFCSIENGSYTGVWQNVKQRVGEYFNDPSFNDGAYTQFLEHLITIK